MDRYQVVPVPDQLRFAVVRGTDEHIEPSIEIALAMLVSVPDPDHASDGTLEMDAPGNTVRSWLISVGRWTKWLDRESGSDVRLFGSREAAEEDVRHR